MTESKPTTWAEWRAAVMREADDIEAAADLLEAARLRPESEIGYLRLGPLGQETWRNGADWADKTKVQAVQNARSKAAGHRYLVTVAKWLGAPARDHILTVVAMETLEGQRAAARKLTKVASATIDNRMLWRLSRSDLTRIDRIVEGARLYAASQGG